MKADLIEEPRVFEIITAEGITALKVSRLSIRKLKQLGTKFRDRVRDERRSELMAVADGLTGKERMLFLVEAAKANRTVSDEEAVAVGDSLYGLLTTLEMATPMRYAELEDLHTVCEDPVELDYARYYALGIDIDEMRTLLESADPETKTGDTFPCQPGV